MSVNVCVCDGSVVFFHSLFAVECPEVLWEGDEGSHHSSFKTPEVCGAFLGDVPGVAGPQEGLEDASAKDL